MEEEPAAAKRRRTWKPHVPHEVVTEILLRLPTRSLVHFSCVCQAWRATISHDPSFRRDLRLHLRDQPCLLIVPQINHGSKIHRHSPAAGLYRWEETHAAATLIHPIDSLPGEASRWFAHCDGLVLICNESAVRVFNPATRRLLTLPESSLGASTQRVSHRAFGLGRDPRTGVYKVARFFQRREPYRQYTPHVEVYTIGADQHWRELAQPPHLIVAGQTATFFKGSLIWIMNPYHPTVASSFLRLKLEDETFSVLNCGLGFDNQMIVSELRGELCVTRPRHNRERIDMWMCDDIDGANPPQWENRYTIQWDWARASLCPIAVLADEVPVCRTSRNRLCRFILHTQKRVKIKDTIRLKDLEYHNHEEGTVLAYPHKTKFSFNVIPYVSSFAPI